MATTAEVARRAGRNRRGVAALCAKGSIPATMCDGRWHIEDHDADAYVAYVESKRAVPNIPRARPPLTEPAYFGNPFWQPGDGW